MKELPENLYAAHQWISAADEWDEAVTDPVKYATEAAANAIENGQFDVTKSDLLDVIAWALIPKQVIISPEDWNKICVKLHLSPNSDLVHVLSALDSVSEMIDASATFIDRIGASLS